MIDRQILVPGDWQVKRPHVQPGGWAFQYDNDFYPDLDDTAMVADGAREGAGPRPRARAAGEGAGLGWFLGMQGQDGGWASFDADNNRLYLQQHPVRRPRRAARSVDRGPHRRGPRAARHARLQTRPRAGPARARLHPPHAAPRRALVRALGRQLHLRHVVGAARRSARSARTRARSTSSGRCAGSSARQNADGGWGETLRRATPTGAGRPRARRSRARPRGRCSGCSPPAATRGPAVERGIRLPRSRTQRADGGWDDPLWNGTGFPRVFYLKYHLYAQYFPLWALGVYRPRAGRMTRRRRRGGPRAAPTSRARSVGSALGTLESLGRFGAFLGQALVCARHAAVQARPPSSSRIHFIGFRSLLIILLTGALHRHGARPADLPDALAASAPRRSSGPRSRSRSSASWARCSRRSWSPAAPARPSPPRSASCASPSRSTRSP